MKFKTDYTFDQISLGEVMLRFDPGFSRIKTSRSFDVFEGGGEYNVARALRKCFGYKTSVITAFAENEIGHLLEDLIMQGGVDTSLIKWLDYDGIGQNVRNGLNFTERGFGIRGALGVSDRGHTAISQIKPTDIDFDYIFGTLGVRLLHTGGIFSALSKTSAEVCLEAVKSAKKHGTIVSYDLNYRPSMWKCNGGIKKAQEVNRNIAKYVDIMIGNEEDFTACLGYEIAENNENLTLLNIKSYEKMIKQVVSDFSNIKVVATTLREVKTASTNNWSAICYSNNKFYTSKKYENLQIFDRVGGGDGFASGLIYALLEGKDHKTAVEYGTAHGALAMTTPGDTSMASLKEVEQLVNGASCRMQR